MDPIDTLRRPEYTGENRCAPCTAVNAAAVAVAAAVAGARRRSLAVPVLAVGAALIYLRGYVVPGTPEFAPKLVRSLGLEDQFRHVAADGESERQRESDDLVTDTDPQELLGAMFHHGVLEEGERDDDALYLSEAFETAWREELADLRAADSGDLVAATAEVVPFEAEGERRYGGVSVEGEEGVVWLRPTNATGDVAAVRAMERVGVPESLRAPATTPLRLFTPECPACGGDLEERTVDDGCCGGTMGIEDTPTRDVLACVDCEAEVHVFDGDEEAA
ncbi:hypothetical protein [Halobaculum gomorrense]|uniref:Uncharacterized protein n=1 Tax=Halobaculum gomorrense TaxID=43928 RepID=A0A1M5REN1_9EURY|nr:hypothetical protein [Halobaculum gomorrense]SHH24721.1 hypothetical protein SAMN05443636_2165 [Halobaculum gomorrense]